MLKEAMTTTTTAIKKEAGETTKAALPELKIPEVEVELAVETKRRPVEDTKRRPPVVEMKRRPPVVEMKRRPVVEMKRRPVVEMKRRPVVEMKRRPVVEMKRRPPVVETKRRPEVEEEEEEPDEHPEEDPKTNRDEQVPVKGPVRVASTHFPVAPHQPQKVSATQVAQVVNRKQSTARQEVKYHWVQLAATPPGPMALPAKQVAVVSHQPQPWTSVQLSHEVAVEQVTTP